MNPMAQAPGPLLPESKLIRADQVPNLVFLSQEEKTKYSSGVAGLRQKMQDNPPNHPDYMNAYHRLSEVTNRLRQQSAKYRQQMGQQMQNAQHPSMQGPREGPPQMVPQDNRQAQQPEFSQRVRIEAKNLQVAIPTSLRARSAEEQTQWANVQRLKYAKILQGYEVADRQLKDLQQQVQARQANNNPLSNEERGSLTQRVSHLNQIKAEAQKAAVTLKQQHEHARQQQMQYAHAQQIANQSNVTGSAAPPSQNAPAQPSIEVSEQDTVEGEELKSGAKEETASVPPGAITHNANIPAPSGQNQVQDPPVGAPSDTSIRPDGNASSPSTNQPGATKPLSHHDAIMRASQNYTQSSQAPHGHPIQPQGTTPQHEQPSVSSNLNRNPPNRPLNVPPPQPVPMPPARPTLPGGPGPAGPMGQPAIPKVPGFVLEGEGERVLSKKKLEELVRQVTGSAGSNENGEALDPDVEEVSSMSSLAFRLLTSPWLKR